MTIFNPDGIDAFLAFWQQKPNSSEGKVAEAHNNALNDFDAMQTGLLRCIRPQKANGKLTPVFAEGSEQLIAGFEKAEKHLADVKADIGAYMALTEGQPSMSGLTTDKLFRAKRQIAEASLEAGALWSGPFVKLIPVPWNRSKTCPKFRLLWTRGIRRNGNLGPL